MSDGDIDRGVDGDVSIYERLGVKRVINLYGAITLLGASSLSPRVMRAVLEANDRYASMRDLRDRAGETIGRILGCESATVTTGTAGGLVLSVAATMAGRDPGSVSRLPDVSGMPHEVLIQAPVRWLYERAVTQTGARLRRAGTATRCTVEDLEAAIGPTTAAIIHIVAPRKARPSDELLDLDQLVEVGHRRDIPVIVDAAGQNFPLEETFRWHAQHGDLVCFGAKYINGPNAAGYVCGRRDLIEAVNAQDFISFDEVGQQGLHGGIGRALKVDRSDIVAAVVSLQEWFEMDHRQWRTRFRTQLRVVEDAVRDIPFVAASWAGHHDGSEAGGIWLRIEVHERAPRRAQEIAEDLAAGDPPIWVAWTTGNPEFISLGSGKPPGLIEGDAEIVAARLVDALGSTRPRHGPPSHHPATLARGAVGAI